MFLGQLYFYDAQLADIDTPVTLDQLEGVEFVGLTPIRKEDYKGIGRHNWLTMIRDQFVDQYGLILQENQLSFAPWMWQRLTSPSESSEGIVSPKSAFQSELLEWMLKGARLEDVKHILVTGSLSDNQDDFALYYGLRVLYIFAEHTPELSEYEPVEAEIDRLDVELSLTPQILVLGSQYLAPLFVNIQCEFQTPAITQEDILQQIQRVIQQNASIELVLIENAEKETLTYLKKRLPESVLVSPLNLEMGQENFFDFIVKKTLGVRLS